MDRDERKKDELSPAERTIGATLERGAFRKAWLDQQSGAKGIHSERLPANDSEERRQLDAETILTHPKLNPVYWENAGLNQPGLKGEKEPILRDVVTSLARNQGHEAPAAIISPDHPTGLYATRDGYQLKVNTNDTSNLRDFTQAIAKVSAQAYQLAATRSPDKFPELSDAERSEFAAARDVDNARPFRDSPYSQLVAADVGDALDGLLALPEDARDKKLGALTRPDDKERDLLSNETLPGVPQERIPRTVPEIRQRAIDTILDHPMAAFTKWDRDAGQNGLSAGDKQKAARQLFKQLADKDGRTPPPCLIQDTQPTGLYPVGDGWQAKINREDTRELKSFASAIMRVNSEAFQRDSVARPRPEVTPGEYNHWHNEVARVDKWEKPGAELQTTETLAAIRDIQLAYEKKRKLYELNK